MKFVNIFLIALSAAGFLACTGGGDNPAGQSDDGGVKKPAAPTTVSPSTSAALPEGMRLVWNDEFNGTALDTKKWCTDYYSTVDYLYKTRWEDFQSDNLPQPAMEFTGSAIKLYTNDNEPEITYWPDNGRKISSIQTYDWLTNKNLLPDDAVGGYLEARIKRTAAASATLVNGAFWMDSPGPDLRYWMESGNTALDATGLRPHGQVFEVDFCENLSTEIVLHGNVNAAGEFGGNMGHMIIESNPKSQDKWIVHGILWTPRGMKFYIDGVEKAQSWNLSDIKSPNHWMNFFLGMYGKGETCMEVDYIRYYKWDTTGAGALPNGGFEYSSEGIFPWEGSGTLSEEFKRTGRSSLMLAPGQSAGQYVYLDHSSNYELEFWSNSFSAVTAKIENIKQVAGTLEGETCVVEAPTSGRFVKNTKRFSTLAEPADHKRTVKITFTNTGADFSAYIDDVKMIKR